MTKKEPRDKQITSPKHSVSPAFPIFIHKTQWDVPDLNQRLVRDLLELRARDNDGVYKSNSAGTWHSEVDLFRRDKHPNTSFQELGAMFGQAFTSMAAAHGAKKGVPISWQLAAWGMQYSKGGYATVHNHPNCHFAGVYYVDGVDDDSPDKVMATGAKVRPGVLEFVNPVPHALSTPKFNLSSAHRVKPQAGLMCIFPAWLNHFVHPVDTDTIRYAIACNATAVDTPQGTPS
jgi:uncharacterized protein (TIGR02466 family)